MNRVGSVGIFVVFALLGIYGAHLVLASPNMTLRAHGLAFVLFGAGGALIGASMALDEA